MDRRRLARRKLEHEIELDNGERVSVPLNTLTIAGTDEFMELSFSIAEKTRQEIMEKGFKGKNDTKSIMKALSTGAYSIGLKNSEPLWKLMTGLKDVSFLERAFPDDIDELQEKFYSINPVLRESKKKLQQDLIMLEALKTFAANILSEKPDLVESSIESLKSITN